MPDKKKHSTFVDQLGHCSPFEGLAYRAVVFARTNRDTSLYFVAGANGGPWSASKALATAHKIHGGECFYCEKSIAKGLATVDHVEPACLGGKGNLSNLVFACKPCNANKGHRVIDAYNPNACEKWLTALLTQVQTRLAAINPAS